MPVILLLLAKPLSFLKWVIDILFNISGEWIIIIAIIIWMVKRKKKKEDK